MKRKFLAHAPDFGTQAVRELRTRDDDRTLAALKAAAPPFDDEVAAELVALAYAFPTSRAHPRGKDVRKQAKKLVDRHVDGASAFAAAFKGIGARTYEFDGRVRKLDRLRVGIAKAIAFHSWDALSVAFEEDAAFRGAILDIAVARAEREQESEVMLGEIYTEWHGSHGSATTTNLHTLPDALAGELTVRRSTYAFTGLSIHGGSLTDLPASLADAAPWLTELSLSFNPLKTVPKVVFELDNLETLELAGTQLEDIPPTISKLRKLRRLDIGNGTRMLKIPDSVCALDQLRELRIGNGSIKLVPAAIAGMKSLEVLELQSTSISKLPAEVATLPKLKRIEARFSRLNAEKARALLPKSVTIVT
jgi:hypothetical protein